MTANKEKALPLEKAFAGIVSNAEELRKIALKLLEKGYMKPWEYDKFCERNKLLNF